MTDLVAVPSASNTLAVRSAASTNATSVFAGAAKVKGAVLTNVAAYDVFMKFYDKATAPVVGTDAPVLTVKVPTGGSPVNLDGVGAGLQFVSGIAFAITKLIADTDATAVAAGDLRGELVWGV